ncbi:MAG: hypothetical protein IBJ09_05810 [Bacteroidia bacterium]|nr:hypothetical protein [Bacteroidia bacterium]
MKQKKAAVILIYIVLFFSAFSSCGERKNPATDPVIIAFNSYLDSLARVSPVPDPGDPAAQTAALLENINGIRQDTFQFFNSEGYNIETYIHNGNIYPGLIGKILKDRSEAPEQLHADTLGTGYICYSWKNDKDPHVSSACYLVGKPTATHVIIFSTRLPRDSTFEHTFADLLVQEKLPARLFSDHEVDSIRFGSRYIRLGNVCKWQGANNIQCSGKGQINWSEFRDMQRAVQMLRDHILSGSSSLGIIEKTLVVPVLFEGSPARALRVDYKIRIPRLLLGGSNRIRAYYVAAPVRGRYIACIMSHYDDEAKEGSLPPLLSEVMRLE